MSAMGTTQTFVTVDEAGRVVGPPVVVGPGEPPVQERFHADVVATMREVPPGLAGEVREGWRHADGAFLPPEAPAAPVVPLAERRLAEAAALREEYTARVAAGMPWRGRAVAIDDVSAARMTAAVSMAQLGALPPGFAWRTVDNGFLRLDGPGLVAMALAAGAYSYGLMAASWARADAIAAVPTEEALDALLATPVAWPAPPESPPPP